MQIGIPRETKDGERRVALVPDGAGMLVAAGHAVVVETGAGAASGFADDKDALPIRADARVLGATLKAGESAEYSVGDGRHAYLVPAVGAIEVDGTRFEARDGAALSGGQTVTIKALDDAEIVLVDAE